MTDDSLELRHLNLMLEVINGYQAHKIALGALASRLEELNDGLQQDMGAQWVQDFNSNWLVLEEIYALSIDRENKALDSSEEQLILVALSKLNLLIKSKLKELGKA
jgi:hypothetical protein